MKCRKSTVTICTLPLLVALIVVTGCNKDEKDGSTVKDYDGNVYKTITIGSQVWMASDLKTTRMNDGTVIQLVTDNGEWKNIVVPGYCWYGNNPCKGYGALYNWYAAGNDKLCPTGWKVPANSDWHVLTEYLGGEAVAGGKMKSPGTEYWDEPNLDATNTSGFSGLPGGMRSFTCTGSFSSIKRFGYWWSSEEGSTTEAWLRSLNYDNGHINTGKWNKTNGCSVRCIKK